MYIFFTDSNHYGIAGWYSMQAANEGLMVNLVIAFTWLHNFSLFLSGSLIYKYFTVLATN